MVKPGKNIIDWLKKPAEEMKKEAAAPLQVGQKVVAAGIESLGEGAGASELRLKDVSKSMGGAALSVGGMIGLRITIPLVIAATLPGAAVIAVPVALAALSTFTIARSAMKLKKKLDIQKEILKEQGHTGSRAFLMALKKNNLEAGAFVGTVCMATIGLGVDLGGAATGIFSAVSTGIGTEGSGFALDKKVEMREKEERERLNKQGSKFIAAPADKGPAEKEHAKAKPDQQERDDLVAKASTSGMSLNENAPKGMDIIHAAKTLRTRIAPLKKSLAGHAASKLAALRGKMPHHAAPAKKQPAL